jgi:hypothetical protein
MYTIYSTRNVILDISIVFYRAWILSYRACILSYRSCILSYRACILSYRVSGFPFSIVFCVYQVFRLSWESFIVWLRSLSGLWIISNKNVRYSPKGLFVLPRKLFIGMFVYLRSYVPIKNFSLLRSDATYITFSPICFFQSPRYGEFFRNNLRIYTVRVLSFDIQLPQ